MYGRARGVVESEEHVDVAGRVCSGDGAQCEWKGEGIGAGEGVDPTGVAGRRKSA